MKAAQKAPGEIFSGRRNRNRPCDVNGPTERRSGQWALNLELNIDKFIQNEEDRKIELLALENKRNRKKVIVVYRSDGSRGHNYVNFESHTSQCSVGKEKCGLVALGGEVVCMGLKKNYVLFFQGRKWIGNT